MTRNDPGTAPPSAGTLPAISPGGILGDTQAEVTRAVVCTACGCVCDDLETTVVAGQLQRVQNACPIAEEWFAAQSVTGRPATLVEGREVPWSEAISRGAEILARSDGPLIYGLSRSDTAGQKAAVRLACDLRGTIDTTASQCHGPSIMAIQEMGESTCTLGEVRNRADLVIYWGCNPAQTHPRHAERYAVFPQGRHIPHGRSNRTVVLVGARGEVEDWRLDPNGARADIVVPIDPGSDFEVLHELLALVRGWPVDDRAAANHQRHPTATSRRHLGGGCCPTNVPLRPGFSREAVLADLARRMKGCRTGIVFFGLGLTGMVQARDAGNPMPGQHTVHLLLKLVAELNTHTRFFARRMRIYGDVTGADNVLCWQTGYPFGVNLGRGYPRYNPGEYTADDLLARGEVDVCLLVGSETHDLLRPESQRTLRRIPTIALDTPGTSLPFEPTVRFTTSPCGLTSGGTIYRMDGVPLSLRSVLPRVYPTDEEVLSALRTAVERSTSRSST